MLTQIKIWYAEYSTYVSRNFQKNIAIIKIKGSYQIIIRAAITFKTQ